MGHKLLYNIQTQIKFVVHPEPKATTHAQIPKKR